MREQFEVDGFEDESDFVADCWSNVWSETSSDSREVNSKSKDIDRELRAASAMSDEQDAVLSSSETSAAVYDVLLSPDTFTHTNVFTRYATMDRTVSGALQEGRNVVAVQQNPKYNWLVTNYESNPSNSKDSIITLTRVHKSDNPSAIPPGAYVTPDGRSIKISLAAFNASFVSLRYANEKATRRPAPESEQPDRNDSERRPAQQYIKELFDGDHTTHTNTFTRYSTMDNLLTKATADNRPVAATRSDQCSSDVLRTGKWLVTGYEPSAEKPEEAMITLTPPSLARTQSVAPFATSRPPKDTQLLKDGRSIRMSLKTFNSLFTSLSYSNQRLSK